MAELNIISLKIINPAGEPVANRFFRQPGNPKELGLVLPGLNYSCDMPLLYFATSLFIQLGCNVLQIRADYARPDFQALPKLEQAQRLGADATAALQACLAYKEEGTSYEQIYLLGKSIGTISMAFVLSAYADLPLKPIWLTPLLRQPMLVEAALHWKGPALWIACSADHTFDASAWEQVAQAQNQHQLLVDQANHRLEISGDLMNTLRIQQEILEAIQEFVQTQ